MSAARCTATTHQHAQPACHLITKMNKGEAAMSRIGRIALGVICSTLMAVAPATALASSPKVQGDQIIKLRARAKNISGYAGPVNTAAILPTGTLYVAEVSGAISYYAKRQYDHPSALWNTLCGEPLVGPHGDLGIDAEFVFARPWTAPCPRKLPVRWDNFELSVNNGSTYAHPIPLNGPFTVPTPGHVYSYAMAGVSKYALFRLRDNPNGSPATADNYGTLLVHVRKAVAADCGGTNYLLFAKSTEAECLAAL
jgi:hypothetical protein